MAKLRLLVDPPYEGEALSSFLGRTAQAYCLPVPTLIEELLQTSVRRSRIRDIDLWPTTELLSALSDAVPGWQPHVANAITFEGWVLFPGSRCAYCPSCFADDLRSGRVPYFRLDWIAVLTTFCWDHGTPLCQWRHGTRGIRKLPGSWLFAQTGGAREDPTFYRDDLDRLARHVELDASESDPGAASNGLALVKHLQVLLEAPLAMRLDGAPLYGEYSHFHTAVRRLSTFALSFLGDGADATSPALHLHNLGLNDWFATTPGQTFGPRHRRFPANAMRVGVDPAWRRTYLWLVARTLASCEPFASNEFHAFGLPADPEEWWRNTLVPACPQSIRGLVSEWIVEFQAYATPAQRVCATALA